jgi:hypothetical protein
LTTILVGVAWFTVLVFTVMIIGRAIVRKFRRFERSK